MAAKARVDLRGAAGDDDLGFRMLTARLANRLPRLAHAFRRHRAGVDDHRGPEPGVAGMLAHDLGFVGIEPAAEGDDLDLRHVAASNTKLALGGDFDSP